MRGTERHHPVGPALLRGALAAGLLCFWVGCARDVPVSPRSVDDASVTVLMPPASDALSGPMIPLLQEEWPAADWVPVEGWEEALSRALAERRVVVIPRVSGVPFSFYRPIESYLKEGGRALFVGTAPYEAPSLERNGRWQHYDRFVDELTEGAAALEGFSSMQLWSHERSDRNQRSIVRVASDSGLPWPGVVVETDQLAQWDRMRWPAEPAFSDTLEGQALIGYFRGGPDTTRLVMRAIEEDGSVWSRVMPVAAHWERKVIPADAFHYVEGGHQRGGASDGLNWDQLAEFDVGLDARYAPQASGSHVYGVSDLRWAHWPAPPQVRYPFIQTPGRRHAFSAYAVEGTRSRALYHVRHTPVDTVWGDPAIRFPDSRARWISLLTARNRAGSVQGDVAGLFLRAEENGPTEGWAWIGMDATRSSREAMRMMLNETLFYLQRGRFVLAAEQDKALYTGDELFQVEATVVSLSETPRLLRVTVEMLDADDRIVRRVVSQPFPMEHSGESVTVPLNAGVVPRTEGVDQSYAVRTALEEVGGSGVLYDRVRRSLRVAGTRNHVPSKDRPRVQGGRIMMGRVPLVFVGVDYEPALERRPTERWLDARYFPAEQVERDLAFLHAEGINAISLTATAPEQAPQLRYVLDEARTHGLMVKLAVPVGGGDTNDMTAIATLLDGLDVDEESTLFALDLTPQQRPSDERLAQRWTEWVTKQYGAPGVWSDEVRAVLNIDEDAQRAPLPSLREDPDRTNRVWSIWHRFAADQWSRRLGYVSREIHEAGHYALQTVRARAAIPSSLRPDERLRLPLTPGTGAAHVDYITLEPGVIRNEADGLGRQAFVAAYTRGITGGKPITWAGVPLPVGTEPRPADFDWQEEAADRFYALIFGTRAVGGWIRQYGPVSAHPLFYDEGITHPGGAGRPVVQVMRRAAHRARSYRVTPAEWNGREAEPAWNERDWIALADNWERVYAEDLEAGRSEEVRPLYFSQPSTDVPPSRLAGLAHGPFHYMNAEWGDVHAGRERITREPGAPIGLAAGQRLRAELVNTGIAAWSASAHRVPGTVWVEVQRSEQSNQYLEMNNVQPTQRGVIEWSPSEPGTYILRAFWLDIGAFGEPITVHVRP